MIFQEIWQRLKSLDVPKPLPVAPEIEALPLFVDDPNGALAFYSNCPAVVCSECRNQTSYYTQFPGDEILCSDCYPQPN